MSNIPELFNSSMLRGLAEQAEKQKFEKEFAFRDQQAQLDESFKQMQFKQLVDQAEKSNAHNIKMENLSQLNNASSEYVGVGPDDPIMKHFNGISSISPQDYMERAGPLSHADPNQRFVEKAVYDRYSGLYNTEKVNDRYYDREERKAKLIEDKQNEVESSYTGLLSRLSNAPGVTADTIKVKDPAEPWYNPEWLTSMRSQLDSEYKSGNRPRRALFGFGKVMDGSSSHDEFVANPKSVAVRMDTLSSVFSDINKFASTNRKVDTGQLKASAFNELVDLAYESQGKNIPYSSQTQLVVNQLMPLVQKGIDEYKIKAEQQYLAAQSKLKSAQDDNEKAKAKLIVDEMYEKLNNPLYGLNHVKSLYLNQFMKKGN